VPEDGDTLEANALAKARAGCRATGRPTLADDSGLFVDALGGAPGVHSARYAGPAGDPVANCAKLLQALSGVPPEERGATFRSVIALVLPDGPEHLFRGACPGRIATAPRGEGGFGYDPLFEVAETGATFAEMTGEQKHGFSHRGRALAALRGFLVGAGGSGPGAS
jgi:XTP/dITP diphosphohydrolase